MLHAPALLTFRFRGLPRILAKIFKVETEYIIVTENSIYIVASDIQNKRIS